MSGGLEAYGSIGLPEQPKTAPFGAVLNSERQNGSTAVAAHNLPVEFKNGLVDPESVGRFMDRCYCPDLNRDMHVVEFHHLYFPIGDFKNNWASLALRRLRNFKTNQILMLNCQEDTYHRSSAVRVEHSKIDQQAAEAFFEEDDWLTEYAATSWMIAETEKKLGRSLSNIARAALTACLELLQEMNTSEAEQLGRIETMNPSIVTGALSRYVHQQREDGLLALVEARIASGSNVIPTKIYRPVTLCDKAEHKLGRRISAESWIVQRILNTRPSARALQTEVDKVELAA